jgi:hypothetical protein
MSIHYRVEFWADGVLVTAMERLHPIKDIQVKLSEYELEKRVVK